MIFLAVAALVRADDDEADLFRGGAATGGAPNGSGGSGPGERVTRASLKPAIPSTPRLCTSAKIENPRLYVLAATTFQT